MTRGEAFLDAIETGDCARGKQLLAAEPDLARAARANGVIAFLEAAGASE